MDRTDVPAPDWAWAICVHCQRKKLGQMAPGQTACSESFGRAVAALWCRTCKKNTYLVPAIESGAAPAVESDPPTILEDP